MYICYKEIIFMFIRIHNVYLTVYNVCLFIIYVYRFYWPRTASLLTPTRPTRPRAARREFSVSSSDLYKIQYLSAINGI